MDEYDSNNKSYNSEMLNNLGQLSERKQKVFNDLTKNPLLKSMTYKEINISIKNRF